MTLLICIFAAIIATVKWYKRKDDSLMLGVPCVLFWGASLMWLGDAIFGYIEDGAEFFAPEAADMLAGRNASANAVFAGQQSA